MKEWIQFQILFWTDTCIVVRTDPIVVGMDPVPDPILFWTDTCIVVRTDSIVVRMVDPVVVRTDPMVVGTDTCIVVTTDPIVVGIDPAPDPLFSGRIHAKLWGWVQ